MKPLIYGIGIVFGCLLISQAVAATERGDLDRRSKNTVAFKNRDFVLNAHLEGVHLLPGGGLPNSKVNMGVPYLPYHTLNHLKAYLAN